MKSKVFYWFFGVIGVALIVLAIATYAMTHRYIGVGTTPYMFDQFTGEYVILTKDGHCSRKPTLLGALVGKKEDAVATTMNYEKVIKLYNFLADNGTENIGTDMSFMARMQNPVDRKTLYDFLDGKVGGIGETFEEFEQILGVK